MKITLPWRRQQPAADPRPAEQPAEQPRRPAPQPDPTDAAIRQISEIARHWIDIARLQANEIARLHAQLAEQEDALRRLRQAAEGLIAESDEIKRVAIHWHTTATEQRRAALPEVWARNMARYVSRN